MDSPIEFLDLSGVEEREKLLILNFLHCWNENVQVPWKKPTQASKSDEGVSNNLHQKVPYSTNNLLLEKNTYDRNDLNPTPHVYQPYTEPHHNQPIYQNIYHEPAEMSMNIMDHCVQVQQVVPNCINNENYYVRGNVIEQANVHHLARHIIEEDISQTSNNTNVNISENHVGENGDCQNNIMANEKNEDKRVVELKPASKSWASLFQKVHNDEEVNGKTNELLNDSDAKTEINTDVKLPEVSNSLKNNYDDPVYYRLGEFLAEHEIDHKTISLQPRGLINRSNYCYINSILQALLACPPVYNLLIGLAERITTNAKRKLTPVIYNMSKFVREFNHLPAAQRVSRRTDKNQKQDPNCLIDCDVPFEPHYIYKMLNGIRSDTFVVEGRQEDAEEFLGCLLNGLNDEMLELMKLINKQRPKLNEMKPNNNDNDQDKEWQEVTGKNKGCVTRRTELVHTPISDIFNGHLRSRVHRAGDKSTDNV
ncbi:Peptidase, partial [Oryctes borbonicus]